MATRPELHRAVQGTKNTATNYNDNFDAMMDFIDDSIDEAKSYVDDFMPSQTGQAGKTLMTDGTNASWVDTNTYFNQLASSGTINLTTNSLNYIEPTGAVNFVLPDISTDTKLNQILVQVKLSTVYSINVGTTHYFNGKSPQMSSTGMYDLIFEYDEAQDVWVVGWMRKS